MFGTALEKSRTELGKLRTARVDLETKAATAETELAKLKADAGETELAAILEGLDAGPTRTRIVELDASIVGLARARTALLGRIAAAHRAVQVGRAEEIRMDCKSRQKKLDSHLKERDRLLMALQEHEGGCPFVPRAEAEQAMMTANPGAIAAEGGRALKWPASMRMAQEVRDLLAQADAIERTTVQDAGSASATNLAELLAAVATNPLAPSEDEIRVAFFQMEASAIEAWERHMREDFALGTGPSAEERVTAYTISWQEGRIGQRSWKNERKHERWIGPPKPVPAEPVEAVLRRQAAVVYAPTAESTGNFGRGWQQENPVTVHDHF